LQINRLKSQEKSKIGGPSRTVAVGKAMDNSMRMVIIAGILMLALLIAIVGSVSAGAPTWASAASTAAPTSQPL
jgi:hypothetical protein